MTSALAEVEIYNGFFPCIMLGNFTSLYSACEHRSGGEFVSDEMWKEYNKDMGKILRLMYVQYSNVTTGTMQYRVRIMKGDCSGEDYLYKLHHKNNMHFIMVDTSILGPNFKDGYYECSLSMYVKEGFWNRDLNSSHRKCCVNDVDSRHCVLKLKILNYKGEISATTTNAQSINLKSKFLADFWNNIQSEFKSVFLL